MAERRSIKVKVNGIEYERLVEPRKHLADFLRDDLELIGTHVGCEHGICGSCTVLMNGEPVRSCLIFAVQADGAEIMTIEGLAKDGKLHPLQEAFQDHHGLQCGFCTPGMLITTYHLLKENPDPTKEEVREAVSGVLCRCTGYRQIIESVMAAAAKMKAKA
jgi:aerobic-type carbon monoxide dehydrogenase small subunit (CoxS/CutS family)